MVLSVQMVDEIRKLNGFSVRELAKKSEVNQAHLSGWFRGACHFLPAWLLLLGVVGLLFCLTTGEILQETLPALCRTKRTASHKQGGSPQDGQQ